MWTLRAVLLCCALNAATVGVGLAAIGASARAQDGPKLDPGDWSVTVGAGAGARPEYEGGKSIDVSPIPLLDIRVRPNWTLLDTVYLSTNDGLGAVFFNNRDFKLGASLGYDFGRDEDDSDRLSGLGEIDAAARLRVFVGTSVGPVDMQLSVQRTIGGVDGTTVSLTMSHTWALTSDLRLRLSAAGDWGDENYMSGYFGVSSEQAARSGLPRYDISSGVKSVSLSTSALYSLSPNWLIAGSLGIKQLLGDAADSPIVESELQPFGVIDLLYRF
ncbi:MAG: MipA/OmpV family protein [Aestuariivirga sp.]